MSTSHPSLLPPPRRASWLGWLLPVLLACGEPVPPPEVPTEVPWSDIAPNDVRVRYTGRVDHATGVPRFSYPGVSLAFRFHGEAVEIRLEDRNTTGSLDTNLFDVVVDGELRPPLVLKAGASNYTLAEKLPLGEHTVQLTKRTESVVGTTTVRSLRVKGTFLEPPPRLERRLEFIGDSITCGYGNLASIPEPPAGNPSTGFHAANQNHSVAWGALTAQALGAEVSSLCYSGRGVWRNLDGSFTGTLPDLYDGTLPDVAFSSPWAPSRFGPQALIINLGSNDFANGIPDAHAFHQAWERFLARLRQYHPEAHLVLAVGPLLSDTWPPGEQHYSRMRQHLQEAAAGRASLGDTRVHVLELETQQPPYGEDWHPSAQTHRRMAERLTALLRSVTGW